MSAPAPTRRLVAGLLVALAALGTGPAAAECRESELLVTGAFGATRFTVEIARTPEEQARGLMFREEMAADAGMLFVYDTPRTVSFWMRNTLIPLDMIFIGPDGAVRHVHAEAIPGDETPIPSRGPVIGVLEINGGLAEEIGIAPGAQVRHPLLAVDGAARDC